jgi:hypothetical protein
VNGSSKRGVFCIAQNISRRNAIADHKIIAKIKISQILALKLYAKGMKRHKIAERDGPVHDREEQSSMMIAIIPVVDRSMDFTYYNVVVLIVIVFDQTSFNAGQKTGGRIAIEANYVFSEKGNLVIQF